MMELLAPAGSWEALTQAVICGADAVYLGYTALGARAGASNFGDEEMAKAIRFCHFHHVRVHVTVNTLVKQQELSYADQVLTMLENIGVDSVLVQDLGVAALVTKKHPKLKLHASTQMSVHNRAGAEYLKKNGFSRVVLARECPIEEIEKVADTGLETEVFVHGALCCSVSGQCLFSSMLGDRSGNRGRCAQPCRLEYTFRGKGGAFLSPRDLMLRDHLPELKEAGVASIKIEGRLKRPEYVSVVVSAYRKALNDLEIAAFQPADAKEKEGLLQIYNRGGFMPGYAFHSQDAGVIAPKRVNHYGVEMGRVANVKDGFAYVHLDKPLHNGDQLEFRGHGADGDVTYSGKEIPAGMEARVRLRMGMHARSGQQVVRLTDAIQMIKARERKLAPIAIQMTLTAMVGNLLTLTLTDGISAVTVAGDEIIAPAKNRGFSKEDGKRSLGKLGDTPFVLDNCIIESDNGFVPVSQLNELRRQGVQALEQARIAHFEGLLPINVSCTPSEKCALPLKGEAKPLIAWCRSMEQCHAAKKEADMVWLEPEDLRETAVNQLFACWPENAWLVLPVQCGQDTLEMLNKMVGKYAHRLGGVVLGSVGQLGLEWLLPMAAGPGIPVMNKGTMEALAKQGVSLACASPELSYKELEDLACDALPMAVSVYGRTRIMLLNHCPARTVLGLTKGREKCTTCDDRMPESLLGNPLIDRYGAAFPMVRTRLPEGCLISLYNSLPINITAQVKQLDKLEYSPLCAFTDEEAQAVAAVLKAVREGAAAPFKGTQGHFLKPIE